MPVYEQLVGPISMSAHQGNMGGVELLDQVAGLKRAAEHVGYLDLKRVAITGWSYGRCGWDHFLFHLSPPPLPPHLPSSSCSSFLLSPPPRPSSSFSSSSPPPLFFPSPLLPLILSSPLLLSSLLLLLSALGGYMALMGLAKFPDVFKVHNTEYLSFV